jgi:hypothetical protein
MKHLKSIRLAAALALAAPASAAHAQLTNINLDINLFGNLCMSNSGPINCGPTSKANSLAYLQRKHKLILVPQQTRDEMPKDGQPDDWNGDGKVDFYDDLMAVSDLLSSWDYMRVNPDVPGCTIEDFVYGQDKYLAGKGVFYKGRISKSWQSNRMDKPDSIAEGTYPDLAYLHGLLSGGYDVELLIDEEDWGGEGHFLTLTGLRPSENKIYYVDPRTGTQQVADILSTHDGKLIFGYTYKDSQGQVTSFDAIVHAAIAEVPEPCCFTLLSLGSLTLVMGRRKR